MSRTIVLASGGIKAVTAASSLNRPVEFVHMDYGQPSLKYELEALDAASGSFDHAPVTSYRVSFDSGSSGGPKTGGHRNSLVNEAAARIMMLLTFGVRHALCVNATEVVTGLSLASSGMELGFAIADGQLDRRREFLHAIGMAAESLGANGKPIRVLTPLVDTSYTDIIKLAAHLRSPLRATRTCIGTSETPCGACRPCRDRAGAFTKAGLVDEACVSH